MLAPLLLGIALSACLSDPKPERLFVVDVVEWLDRGKEISGQAELQVERFLFTYQFATVENRARFLTMPERYEVQLGGACARMGPLSGRGDARIAALHDGKLYIFASQGCRDGFLKAPEKLLERADARPAGDSASEVAGRKWIARACEVHGSAERLKHLQAVRWHSEVKGGVQSDLPEETTFVLRFPSDFRSTQRWGKSRYGELVLSRDGWFSIQDEHEPMAEVQRAAAWRQVQALPLFVLSQSERNGFLAVEGEEITIDARAVRLVHTYCQGRAVTLGIDSASGHVVLSRASGRGPSLAVGTVELRYDDFRTVGGVVLPWREQAFFDGKPFPRASHQYDKIEVNPELVPSIFARPR